MGGRSGVPRPPLYQPPNPFGNTFTGASQGLIHTGISAYGEKLFVQSSDSLKSNVCVPTHDYIHRVSYEPNDNFFCTMEISKYFSDPQYYFQVNDQYVRNKLKVILFPFLHRGHWTRITEPMADRLSYKPPVYDINAPDLYIPFMAFGTYIILAGFSLGLLGKFSPEALSLQFTKGILGWFLQVLMLKTFLYSLRSGEAPLLDIVAYGGYAFTGVSVGVLGRIVMSYSYYFLMPWTCLCMGMFLVKTMKRVLFAEVRSYDSSRHHYLLLLMAVLQFPLFFWLGRIGA